jgi:hypothetical protein
MGGSLQNSRKSLLLAVLIIFGVAGLLGLTLANYRYSVENPGGNDFLARWMGARYWVMQGISPYDEQVSFATQDMIYGHPANVSEGEDKNHFVYPMTSMIFFAPFGLLDYPAARPIWMTILEVSLIALAIIGLRLSDWSPSIWMFGVIMLFSMFWYHGLRTIIVGQFAAIEAILIIGSLYLIKNDQDLIAGFLLALATSKPQMAFLIIPFVLLWSFSRRRWEIWIGFWIALIILLASSLILLPSWPLEMFRQLLNYPSYTNIGSPLSIISGSMPGIQRQVSYFLHGIAAFYLLVEWVLAYKKDDQHFIWTGMITLVVTNLVALRTATTNYVILLPALLLMFRVWIDRWGKLGELMVWGCLTVMGLGLWILFISTVEGNVESALMYLPLPFFLLIGLWWIRWWAIKPPRVLLDHFPKQ